MVSVNLQSVLARVGSSIVRFPIVGRSPLDRVTYISRTPSRELGGVFVNRSAPTIIRTGGTLPHCGTQTDPERYPLFLREEYGLESVGPRNDRTPNTLRPLIKVVTEWKETEHKDGTVSIRPTYAWLDPETGELADTDRVLFDTGNMPPIRGNTPADNRRGRRVRSGYARHRDAARLDAERMTGRCSVGSRSVTPDFEGMQREVQTRTELFALTTPELVRAMWTQAYRMLNTERPPIKRNADGTRGTPRPLTDVEQALRKAGSLWSGIPNSGEYASDAIGYLWCGFRWYRPTKKNATRTDLERMPGGDRLVLPTLPQPERLVSLISGAALAVRHDDKRKPASLFGKTEHEGVQSKDIDRLGRVRSYALAPIPVREPSPLITERAANGSVLNYRISDLDTIGNTGVRVSAGKQLRQVTVRKSEPNHTIAADARMDAEPTRWWNTLTDTERSIMLMVHQGMSHVQIARNLNTSRQTVDLKVKRLRERMA